MENEGNLLLKNTFLFFEMQYNCFV